MQISLKVLESPTVGEPGARTDQRKREGLQGKDGKLLFVVYDSLIPKGQTKIVPNQTRNNGQNTDLKAANIDSKKFFI